MIGFIKSTFNWFHLRQKEGGRKREREREREKEREREGERERERESDLSFIRSG